MPSYGSLHSPSLSKMNGNHIEGGSARGFGSSFSFGGYKTFRKEELVADLSRAYCWRSICSCDYLNCLCGSTYHKADHPYVTDNGCIVGLAHRLCRLSNFRYPIRFSELRMVGYRIHALLYRGCASGGGIRLNTDISCRGTRWALWMVRDHG